jgi:hypothetical protein
VAQEYFTLAKAQNQQFEAWYIPTSEPFPRHVVMRMRTQQAGQRVDGVVTVEVWGSNALIRGFHGPLVSAGAAGEIREARTLTNVVGSFQVELPMPRQRFREPSQSAFDAMAPEGWQATGRVRQKISMITCEYFAQKDAAGLTQAAVPGDLWQYADGPLVGLCMLGLMGTRRFVPAGKFGPEIVARRFKNQVHQHIEDVSSAPHVLPRFYGDLARIGLDPQTAETSTACVVSNHLVGGVRIRQKSFIGTARVGRAARWSSQFAGQWFAELLSYYHAPESEFERVEPILAGVADSFQVNNEWVERKKAEAMQMAMIVGAMLQAQAQQQAQMMQQQQAQHHAYITHNQDHIHQNIMSSWEERNKVMDHVNHQWFNVTGALAP